VEAPNPEADREKREDIGDVFRQVAAGVTVLESRATGELPAAEVIMLALAPAWLEPQQPPR
jgi:hypothetical protein